MYQVLLLACIPAAIQAATVPNKTMTFTDPNAGVERHSQPWSLEDQHTNILEGVKYIAWKTLDVIEKHDKLDEYVKTTLTNHTLMLQQLMAMMKLLGEMGMRPPGGHGHGFVLTF